MGVRLFFWEKKEIAMRHFSQGLITCLSTIAVTMVSFFFMLTIQTIYWTAQPETASLAIADDGDDLLLSIVPVLAAVAAKSRLEMDITAPVNGDKLTAGEWYWIIWRGSSAVSNFDIELSTDAGATYPIKIVSSTPNDGSYVWGPVPFHDPTKLSSSCKIRIKDSANPDVVLGQSDGLFTLQSTGEPVLLQELCDDNDALANDPLQKDTDDDGLYDNVEIYLGTDPLNWDSDRDGYNDYREVFPDDVLDRPVPDGDGDGKIAAVDNDDDNDGLNDGRILDSDGDTIPDYLETYGFVYDSTSTLAFYPWDGDIEKYYYKTNPRQSSTDQDQYSDLTEITGTNMDLTVKRPGDKPMIAALPIFVVRLTDYTVALNSTITETDGTVHTDASTWDQTIDFSTSTTDEWHLDATCEVSCSLEDFGVSESVTFGVSQAKTITSGTAESRGGEMSDATEWSKAVSTNPSEAAKVKLNLTVQNIGTCSAQDIAITMSVKLGDMEIATLTHPTPPGTIASLAAGELYHWVSDWVPLTMNELRALRCGAPVSIEITDIAGDVVYEEGNIYYSAGSWNNYFAAANATAAHLLMDLGDGTITEQLVYAGAEPWEPVVTLKDALIWAANGQETAQGPMVQFYQPGGSLGDAAPLDDWYFSLDQGTYDEISDYVNNPDFNLFDTVLKPGSVIVAKAPPINPTPDIHWAVLSPRNGTVTAYVDDYFFTQKDKIQVWFLDKYSNLNEMAWDDTKLCFACACPTNADGSVYFKDGTEKIVAQNALYKDSDTKMSKFKTEMPVSEMQYLGTLDNFYQDTRNFCNTPERARAVAVSGDYAYVACADNRGSGLQVVDISDPAHPVIAGSCDTSGYANGVFVSGGYAYVADDASGLHVINISDPTSPSIVGSYDTSGYAKGVFVSEGYAYVACADGGGSGLEVINISVPERPSKVGWCDTPYRGTAVFVSEGYAYVTDWGAYGSGLEVINISDPEKPSIVGSCDMGDPNNNNLPNDVFVSEGYAYVADNYSGLRVVDISNKVNPVIAISCDNLKQAEAVFVSGGYAYVTGRLLDLKVLSLSDPKNPVLVGTFPKFSNGIYVKNNLVYGIDDYGLYIVDAADHLKPKFPDNSSIIGRKRFFGFCERIPCLRERGV